MNSKDGGDDGGLMAWRIELLLLLVVSKNPALENGKEISNLKFRIKNGVLNVLRNSPIYRRNMRTLDAILAVHEN